MLTLPVVSPVGYAWTLVLCHTSRSFVSASINMAARSLAEQRKDVAWMINQKLRTFVHQFCGVCSLNQLGHIGEITGVPTAKMLYQNFEQHIILKYGVTLENWPLKELKAPSDTRTRPELKTLHDAWKSNFCRFRKLTPEEHSTIEKKYFPPLIALISSSNVISNGISNGVGSVTSPNATTSNTASTSHLTHLGGMHSVLRMWHPTLQVMSLTAVECCRCYRWQWGQ